MTADTGYDGLSGTLGGPSSRLGQALDLAGFLDIFQRRWKAFLAVVATVLLATLIAASLLTSMYASTAQVKIDPSPRSITATAPSSSSGLPDQGVVDTEVSIMRSRDIAAAVVDRLGLARLPEFNSLHPSLMARLFGSPGPPLSAADKREVAIGSVLGHLDIRREGVSYVVDLTARSKDPMLAARIANAFADVYILSNLETRVGAATRQSEVLNQRLAELGGEAEAADAAVARYKAENGLSTSGGNNGPTVTDQQIVPLSTQLATAESDAAAAQAKLDAARAQNARGGIETISNVLNSAVIADLRRQRTEIVRNAAEINARYGPLHPESIRVRQQLQGLDRQIMDESRRILAGLQSDAQAASARAASLRGELGQLKSAQAVNERASVTGDSLQRQADAKRLVYNQFSQAAQQIAQERQSQEPQARNFDRAVPAGAPSFPNRRLFAVLGLVVGAIAGAALIMILEALDAGVRTLRDVEQGLGARLVSILPLIPATRGRRAKTFDYVVDHPASQYAEAIRTIRRTLQLEHQAGSGRIVTVTSAVGGEGKSTCAVALARIMGLSGDRVVLIDCDLRRHALQALAAAPPPATLLDVLSGRQPLAKAVRTDKVAGVDLIMLDRNAFSVRDVFGGPEMKALLAALRQDYDYVILDAPPTLALADARILSALADDVLMVTFWDHTRLPTVRTALSRLRQDGAPVRGVVLSRVNTSHRNALGPGAGDYFAASDYFKP